MCAAKSNTVHVLNYQNPRSEKSVKIIRLYLVAAPPRFPRTLHGWCGVSEILLQSSSNLPGDLLQKLWSEKWRVDSRASNEGYPKVREDFTIMEKAFSWLKAPTSTFTFKTLLRHYAEQV